MTRTHPCKCTHTRAAHQHYRNGSDCGICGPEACSKFRAERHVTLAAPAKPAAMSTVAERPTANVA